MAEAVVEAGRIVYREHLRICEIWLEDLVWAYLQAEDGSARMCGGSSEEEPGRVIVVDRNGKREIFRFASMQEARELLEKIHKAKPEIAIGYTEENRARFDLK